MKQGMWILFLCVMHQAQIICMDGNPLSLRGVLRGHGVASTVISLDRSSRAKQAEEKLKKLDKSFEPIFKELSCTAIDALGMYQAYNGDRKEILATYQCTESDIQIDRPFWYCPPLDEEFYQKQMDVMKKLLKEENS